ncbi:hypothetical protein U9M48_034941 [Paspalum notatum var. saurae]|uniref:BED-type domain-containing protein n=1 Tax=Paspalum notatum var. saurae TaxID=547442 RepID=A0AAQ3UEA2_PASNO
MPPRDERVPIELDEQQKKNYPLWNHVVLLEKAPTGGNSIWRCKYCNQEHNGSYSRVRNHLLRVAGTGIKICPKVTKSVLAQLKSEVAKAAEDNDRSKAKDVPLPGAAAGSSAGSGFPVKKRLRSSALEKAYDMENRNQLDALIARLFYSGGISFNIARNPYYREAFKFAANHNLGGYVPPSYNKLRTTLLKQERAHVESLLDRLKSVWPEKGVTICSDGWTDAQRRPLINFIAVAETSPMFLRAIDASGDEKTKEYIAEKLVAVVEEVGPKNVVQIITDNAANCKGAGLIVQQKYDNIFWTPCVVHTLNLALKNICAAKLPRTEEQEKVYDELHWITLIAGDVSFIKNYIMNHGMRLSMFNEFSKLKLLAVAETRFASVVVMLKRFLLVKRALQSMVISEAWETYRDDNSGQAQFVREKILCPRWWENLEYIVDFTDPIYEMLRVADTDKPCLHLIYEMWDTMIENVKKVIYTKEKKRDDEQSTFFTIIYDILVDRWTKSNTPLHCLAHSLNPRYYHEKWLNERPGRQPPHQDLEISVMRMKCFRKFFPVTEDLNQVKDEYSRFATCSEELNDFDSIYDRWVLDPVKWWVNHGQPIPMLQKLALKLLNQPASSSCCERNWSTYSFIHSMKRNKLAPERAEDLVFVHNNLRLLSRKAEDYKTGPCRMWDVGGDYVARIRIRVSDTIQAEKHVIVP